MVLEILFWVLVILCLIGVFVPEAPPYGPYFGRARWVIALILFVILGLRVFGGLR